MSYIDTAISKNGKLVYVWEREQGGETKLSKYPAPYNCFIEKKDGKFKSIFPNRLPLELVEFRDQWELEEFRKDVKEFKKNNPDKQLVVYESDVSPDLKILASKYYKQPVPDLHITFFDIEADADLQTRGWSSPQNPYGKILSISIYHQWLDRLILLSLIPEGVTEVPDKEELKCDELYYFKSEEGMLAKFIGLIHDSDVLSGWNSDKFDIPYFIERLKMHLEEDAALKALCRGGFKASAKQVKMMYSKEEETVYRLVGRQSLDYMQVYKKFTFQEQPSYSLENIAQFELGYGKIEFDGNLPDLFRNDLKQFLTYNLHDVILLRDIDRKLQFFSLLNEMAHDCTARLNDVLGTVVMTDQAMMAYAWHERGQRIPDRGSNYGLRPYRSWINSDEGKRERKKLGIKDDENTEKFVGAYVYPLGDKRGLHEFTASMDLASLYPNTIIALNVSPETALFPANRSTDILWDENMSWETGGRDGMRWGARKDIVGLFPEVLSYWYEQRKELQRKMRGSEGAIKEYYKRVQHVKKIQLNSAYGALGNKYSHFYNLAFAEAVTFGGRGIVQHMMKNIGNLIDDQKDLSAPSIIYGDTDSCYFKLPYVKNTEEAVVYADYLAKEVNATFPEYMKRIHNCDDARADRIQAERETVADRSLFVDKKRYALHVVNDGGNTVDKMKIMGLEIVQSSTPKSVKEFLGELFDAILKYKKSPDEIAEIVHQFRRKFNNELTIEEFGMPKGVNKVEDYANRILIRQLLEKRDLAKNNAFVQSERLTAEEEEMIHDAQADRSIDPTTKKTRWEQITTSRAVPGHVQASLNWNKMLEKTNDKTSSRITSGMKIRVYYLLKNPYGFTSIAIPSDEARIPEWFKELPFDMKKMGEVLIDQKIRKVYSALGWSLPKAQTDDKAFEGFLEF